MRVVEAIGVWRRDVSTTKADFPTRRSPLKYPQEVSAGACASATTAADREGDGGGTKKIVGGEAWEGFPRASGSPGGASSEEGTSSVAAPQGLSSPIFSRDGDDVGDNQTEPHGMQEIRDSRDEVGGVNEPPRKPDTAGGGSREPRTVIGGGGSGRVGKGRWVVTMMVPGRKLWGSSPAVLSQYKRFRRSSQQPKIARDQVQTRRGPCPGSRILRLVNSMQSHSYWFPLASFFFRCFCECSTLKQAHGAFSFVVHGEK